MAAKVEMDPALALKTADSWSAVLKYALEHPTFDTQGRLSFRVRPARSGGKAVRGGSHPPIGRVGEPFLCANPTGDSWYPEDLVTIALLLRDLARYLAKKI